MQARAADALAAHAAHAPKCARLARHAHNIAPLLEKLAPRLEAASLHSRMWSVVSQGSAAGSVLCTPRATDSLGGSLAGRGAGSSGMAAAHTMVGPRAKAALLRAMAASVRSIRSDPDEPGAVSSRADAEQQGVAALAGANAAHEAGCCGGVASATVMMSEDDAAFANALVPQNSGMLPAEVLDAVAPVAAVRNERALAEPVILGECDAYVCGWAGR